MKEELIFWLQQHKFETYERNRAEMENMDWSQVYPVIDRYTRLTGELYDATTGDTRYKIVDIRGRKIIRHGGACDAVIKSKQEV